MGWLILPAVLFYARKDIEKNKKKFFFIIVTISLVGANMIILNGFMDGYVNDFLERTQETSTGHLNIYPKWGDQYIEGLGIKEQKIENVDGVFAYSPRLSVGGSLSYKEKSKPIKILALDPIKENKVTKLLSKLDSGETLDSNDMYSVLVTYRLADELKIKAGNYVTLVFEKGNSKIYLVKGILRTGLEMDKNTVIMNFEEVTEQLDFNNKASLILVKLNDKAMVEEYKNILSQELSINKIKIWSEEIESVVSSMKSYREIIDTVNAIGLFVAAVTLGIILYINVLYTRREIGILKAIGMKDSQVLSVYLIESLLIGIIGIFIGSILGYLGIKYLEKHPFYDPILGFVSPHFYGYLIYDAAIVIFFTLMLAALYPVLIASKTNIIKAIWGD